MKFSKTALLFVALVLLPLVSGGVQAHESPERRAGEGEGPFERLIIPHEEVAWRNFYRVWMDFLNDYKNHGGRVTTGSESGFIYKV
jgi:hypothetical protein